MNKDRDNRKEALGELVRFALVGGLATLLHWLIYWGMLLGATRMWPTARLTC